MSAVVGSGLADRSGSLIAGRVVRAPPHQGGRSMAEATEAFVGIDVAKLRNAVAVADAGRDGEVRFYGEVDASPESMRRLAAKLAGKQERLHFCYEAGPTGYGLQAASKDEKVARVRVALEHLLDLEREPVDALAHVGAAGGQPDP